MSASDADYLELAQRVAETNTVAGRLTNIFEQFDVPEALNYLVLARWVHENDDVWANMSLYRDSDGDARWRILPFDMNLSWGAIFAEGTADLYTGVIATNDNHKSSVRSARKSSQPPRSYPSAKACARRPSKQLSSLRSAFKRRWFCSPARNTAHKAAFSKI